MRYFKAALVAIFALSGSAVAFAQPAPTPELDAPPATAPAAAEEEADPVLPAAPEEEAAPQQSQLARILQGLSWANSKEEVLTYYREEYLSDYRADIAGMRDTIRIDEIRRFHDDRYQRVQEAIETFESSRTGYEASVLGGEVAGGNDESLITVRTDNAQLYYIFASDRLYKVVVAYNSSYLGGLSFEGFLEQVERRYGPVQSSEMGETQAGIRYLARARWEDGDTRLRIENQSNLFGTFIMVFTNTELEDRVLRLRGQVTESNSAVVVSDLINRLGTTESGNQYRDIADEIIGTPTEVELVVPEANPVDLSIPEASATVADGEEEGDGEEVEPTPRRRDRDDEEEEEEEGISIY